MTFAVCTERVLKLVKFMSEILNISGKVTQKFGRMIQISGTTYVKTQ